MFNNDITYADKHDTPENQAALAVLRKKFFPRSECCADCPPAWAPEVLALLEDIDEEWGIARNETTLGGYTPSELAFWKVVLKNPRYAYRLAQQRFINPLINRILKPKISLGQVKEKYGTIRLYISGPEYITEYIEKLVRKMEIRLAQKGVYYPVESFYYANTSSWVESGDYKVETIRRTSTPYELLSHFHYREIMRRMGFDMANIKNLADKTEELAVIEGEIVDKACGCSGTCSKKKKKRKAKVSVPK